MKLRNVANTFDGYFVNTNLADRIYTLQDAAGTLAFLSDITGTNSGTNTGDQTINNTSDATSHTVTLSASGGSIQLVEGTGITLDTTGTGLDGIVTINAPSVGGDVIGPGVAVDSNFAAFDSTTGKLIKDSGSKASDFATPSNSLKLDQTTPQTIINGQPIQDTLTVSELVATDGSKKLQSLAVGTYPSLTELSYVKGATSTIQTQITNKLDKQFAIDINRQGFLNSTETTISFATTTFTLTDVGAGWSYYRTGVKYTISGNKTVALSAATAGIYYIYIDATDGTLTCSAVNTPWTLEDSKVPVATVTYNSTLTPTYWLAEERHTALIDTMMQ
jgi:hypothetical protein